MGPEKAKKRKRASNGIDTSKPTAVFQPSRGRSHTLSIALPGMHDDDSAQSHELKTTLAGQIARALAVFCVDEVIIFDDGQAQQSTKNQNRWSQSQSDSHQSGDQAYAGYSDPDQFLIHLLSYLETPPNLRVPLFPMHPNLRTAGTLPSLDMPHHLKAPEWCQYREGVTVEGSTSTAATANGYSATEGHSKKKKKRKPTSTAEPQSLPQTLVEAGLERQVLVDAAIPPYTRVTLKFPNSTTMDTEGEVLAAEAVAPDAPREEAGYYWGYAVRRASSISAVFTECTFDGGYDVTFGTSERGRPLAELLSRKTPEQRIPKYKHLLLVFGGVAGLEVAVKADKELIGMSVLEPEGLFDHWVNLCPGQGSRTIRTEEAVWIGLMGLRDYITTNSEESDIERDGS
ncbi:MAG: hypothetical protein M1827_007293 [Pycnora praestabilis]|nr:MAG: hypothetical protein M1827_007293 [Pycnora praestabilis]